MNIKKLSIPDVKEIAVELKSDHRGSFARLFCPEKYAKELPDFEIKQVNSSMTLKTGAIRGLHFQKAPHSETKVITCIRGRVFDVAVDLRRNSKTFLQWTSTILDSNRRNQLLIPHGFAHGFQVLDGPAELIYLHDKFYVPQYESGIRFDDPKLAISWPLEVSDISERDLSHPPIDANFSGV